MNDMDVEHHEELHRLALAIDNYESRIKYLETHWFDYEDEIDRIDNKIDASINEIVNNLPKHIVLTKEEYDNLENPDYNSFYFTYEDENSI